MISILALLLIGLFLSGFFSGSETGFYRVARVRLVLDARDGDWISRGLLWLTNAPALFVATTLVGNNVANYCTSLAIVLLSHRLFPVTGHLAELIGPIVFSPVVFVYGELLPKNLFYHAPNKLLRIGGPVFLVFTLLFLPFSAALYVFAWLLQKLTGATPLRLQLTLARKELQQILLESKEAGILQAAQQELAESLFDLASHPVSQLAEPISKFAVVTPASTYGDALAIARRAGTGVLLAMDARRREVIGYHRSADLLLDGEQALKRPQPLEKIPARLPLIAALIKMRSEDLDLVRIVSHRGDTLGLLTESQLTELLFRGN